MSEDKNLATKSATTVTVACKHPPGLILRLFKKTTRNVPVLGGGMREEEVAEPIPGKIIEINGPQRPFGEEPKCLVVAGYALTTGVPIEDWKLWKEQNADSHLLKNKLLFAYETPERATAAAKEHTKTRSGLEPLDMSMKTVRGPDGSPRMVASDDRVPRAPGLSIQKDAAAA